MRQLSLAVLLGLSTLAGGMISNPSLSVAQGVQFDLRNGDIRVQRGDDYDPRYDRRHDRHDERRYDERRYDDRYERRSDRRPRGGCSPRQALAAASNFVRSPRIVSVNREYYLIDGYGKSGGGRGRPDSVEIYNAPGCDRR